MNEAATYLVGLPAFLAYFGVGVALLALFAFIYILVTPHDEWQLIKSNQPSAAIAFSGSLLGFVLPLYSAISHSVDLIDCAMWGGIALLIQVLTFLFIRLILRDVSTRISNGELASAILVAALSVAVGVINAASMTY